MAWDTMLVFLVQGGDRERYVVHSEMKDRVVAVRKVEERKD